MVDPPGSDPAALLQRTGLTLTSGRVVFGFGGNYGDCSTYRGWVVGVDEAGGTLAAFGVDRGPGQSQGAVWMGGAAPAVDGAGRVWVGVGNGSVTSGIQPYDYSDSVLELSPGMQLVQYFAPASWPSDNASDLDLSMAPVLLADGQVLIAGKAGIAYLLDGARLGGIGGARASLGSICGDDVVGGSAVVGQVVYLPCLSGVIAVRVGASPASLRLVWKLGDRGRPSDRRCGPGVDDRWRWRTVGLGPDYRCDPPAGRHRLTGQPLPDPERRGRPAGRRRRPTGWWPSPCRALRRRPPPTRPPPRHLVPPPPRGRSGLERERQPRWRRSAS